MRLQCEGRTKKAPYSTKNGGEEGFRHDPKKKKDAVRPLAISKTSGHGAWPNIRSLGTSPARFQNLP